MLLIKSLLVLLFLCFPALAQQNTPQPPIKIIKPAAKPVFHLPVACTPSKDCWVLNYPDVGPDKDGKGTDSACLARTYDDHKGTDIAIPDEAAMLAGVNVLAAADGTVSRVRDGEADRFPTAEELETTKKNRRECGNAVLIEHGDRWGGQWQTMYCHMKKGSITVKPGQSVKAGDPIGQIGLSGMTEFPHLHFGVIHAARVIDPFTGADLQDGCIEKQRPLWDAKAGLTYQPLSIFAMGFDTGAPSLSALDRKQADARSIPADSPALLFHAQILGAREGDEVSLSITAPDGTAFAQNKTVQEKTRARQMYYVGRKSPQGSPLKTGIYTGKINISRSMKDGTTQSFSDQRVVNVTQP